MDMRSMLTTKLGPLPTWAYGLAAGGGIAVWLRLKSRGEKTVQSSDEAGMEGSGVVEAPSTTLGNGYGSYPYPTVGGDGYTDFATGGQGVEETPNIATNPNTGNPYEVDLAINEVYLNAQQQRLEDLTAERDTALQQRSEALDAAAALRLEPTTPVAESTAPAPPSSQRATPLPALPPRDTVVWSGAAKPDAAIIKALLLERYGRPVSWRTVDNGRGKTPRFVVKTN